MLNKNTIINTLKNESQILKNQFHIQKMGLFGSFSTNTQNPQSDIDFIIELDQSTEDIYRTKKELKQYLKSLFERDIDLAHYKYLKPYAKKHILNEVEPIV